MKKILLSFLFTLCTSLSFAYDIEVDGIYYNLIEKTKEAEVTYKGQTHYEVKTYSGSIIIPSSIIVDEAEYIVKSIGQDAFNCCFGLTSVTIPESVTKIGTHAFYECRGLKTITIPNTITEIGFGAFGFCSALEYITIPESVTSIPSSAFYGCTSLSSVVVPSSVTKINNSAFYGCIQLKSISIPYSVTTIDDSAFACCSNLASVSIPSSVTKIGKYTFSECTSLISIIIPNSIMSIGGGTFRGCSKLKYVTLGDKVKYINSYAFAECKNLETFICLTASVPDTDADTFKDSYIGYSTLIVPEESIEDYKITAPWKEFGTIKSREETDIPTTKKCSKPSITYENGKLYFHTETEGAQIVSEIKCEDIKKSYDNEVSLTATYDITAFAIKANHENSDTTTAKLVWLDAHLKEISTYAKKINVISKPLLITQDAGMVAISGLKDEQKITIFDALGKHILTTKTVGPETKLNLSSERGKLVIVNVERNNFKMIVK